MATICDLTTKSDADILTDLQAISSNVTAFEWSSPGVPCVTTTDPTTHEEKIKFRSYFSEDEHRTWIDR